MTSGLGIARVALRATLGTTMIAHGVRHGRSLPGTARWFGGIGFRQPELQAKASAVVEIGAGSAVAIGAATPAACASIIGTMAVAARTVHAPNGYFVINEGYEYVLALSAMAVALSALGPGRLSVDRALGVDERLSGPRMGVLAGLGGLVGAGIQLAVFWRKPVPA